MDNVILNLPAGRQVHFRISCYEHVAYHEILKQAHLSADRFSSVTTRIEMTIVTQSLDRGMTEGLNLSVYFWDSTLADLLTNIE